MSSLISICPQPYLAGYSASKAFDDKFTKGLYFEMKGSGVDVLGLYPAAVATPINGFKEKTFQIISAKDCAVGALNNATSFVTYGGWVHEIHALFLKSLFVGKFNISLL